MYIRSFCNLFGFLSFSVLYPKCFTYICPAAAAAAKSLQLCLTLCDPIDGSPLGSSVLGILQARTLEWAAISFSNAWKWKVKVKSLSRARLLATPWTGAYQAPPSMGFSWQESCSGVPLPSPIYALLSTITILYGLKQLTDWVSPLMRRFSTLSFWCQHDRISLTCLISKLLSYFQETLIF